MLKRNFFFNASAVLALFIGLNFVAIATPFDWYCSPNSAGAYEIANSNQLEMLAMFVNDEGGMASYPPVWTSAGKTFILMDDIAGFDKPIGTESNPFMGTFDGNGKTITVSISLPTVPVKCAGIFGYTDGATIKNLTTSGSIVYYDNNNNGISSVADVGAIVCGGNYTTITNCTNLADISIQCYGSYNVGGIAGDMWNSTITSCSNSGNIMSASDYGCYTGGIVGYLVNGTISQCANIGKVKGAYYIGGIVGVFLADNINNCVNAGWVNGKSEIGGIIGSLNRLGTMHSCLNTGVIQGNVSNAHSLIGYNSTLSSLSGKISNCYYDNQMSIYTGVQGMTNTAAGVQGLSTDELTRPAIRAALGVAWIITPNVSLPNAFLNQARSYPTLYGIVGADNNVNVHALAAMPVRLSSGTYWNNVGSVLIFPGSVVTLDVGYWTQQASWRVSNNTIQWEAKADFMNMPVQSMETFPNGSYSRHFHNPNGQQASIELTAYMDVNGYRYKKTVPIITNGTPFKINIDEYETYGFEASEVTPNIVTNNAVIDISSAIEGNLHIAIFDMSGAEVMNVVDRNVTAQSQTQVELNDLQNLASGSYMVAVSLGNNVVFRKFIKQ